MRRGLWIRLTPPNFKPRPYRKGDRLRHDVLGCGTFIRHRRNKDDHRYLVLLDDGPREVELLAAFCVGKLRKIRKAGK